LIILEIRALYREFFENRNHIKFIAFMATLFLLLDYVVSLIAQEFILDNYVLVCNSLLVLGLFGIFSKQSLFLKYFFSKSAELLKIPRSFKKLLFFKSIKYELMSGMTYSVLLSYAVFAIIINKISWYCFFCTVLSICLFLLTQKVSELFKSKLRKKGVVSFVLAVLSNLMFILIIYFSYSHRNIVTSCRLDELKKIIVKILSSHLNIYLLFSIIISLYLLTYSVLISLLYRNKIKWGEEFKQNMFFVGFIARVKNPILKKQIYEFKNNVDKYNITSNIFSQIVSIMMMKFLTMIDVIRVENMSMTEAFAIILVMLIMISMNGIFSGLKFEGKRIIPIIQSGYPMENLLYSKIKILFMISSVYALIIALTFLFCGFIHVVILLQLLPLLVLSSVVVAVTTNLYSNLYIRYTENVVFEDTISLLLNSFSLFTYLVLVNFPMLMGSILKIPEYTMYNYIVVISITSSLINLSLIKIFRKRFYGNYKKFIN
jgi:hypothetical protein